MIKLVKADPYYEPDLGDVICDWFNKEARHYLVAEEGPGTDKIIPFVCAYPNPFDVCKRNFEIDVSPIIAKYECPYTRHQYFAIVPVALLLLKGDAKEYEKKLKYCTADYVMDWEWHIHMIKDKRLDLYEIPKLLLGSGYTHMTGHYDGSGSHIQRRVMLENGDALWCYFWEWYNK